MSNRVNVDLDMNVQGYVQGIDKATKSTADYETEVRKVRDSTTNFRKEIGAAKKDALNLAAAYSRLSAEAKNSQFGKEMARQLQEAKNKAAEYIDMQGDLSQELKNLASDTHTLDMVAEGMGVVGDVTAATLGIVAEFTGNEEDAQKAVVAFTTAQAALGAVTKLQNALQMQSNTMMAVTKVQTLAATAATNLKTAAEGKNIVVTKAATVAQKALNAVAKANPYVLLATAIIGVTAALGTYMYMSSKARKEEEAHQKQLETTRKYHEKLNEQLGSSIPTFTRLCTEWKNLRTEADKKQWIKDNQTEFNNLGISVNSVTDAENVFVKNTNAVVKALMLRAQAAANAALAEEEWKEVLKENSRLEELRGRKDLNPNDIKGVDAKNVKHERRGWLSELYSIDIDKQKEENLKRGKKTMQQYIDQQLKLEKEGAATLKNAGIKSASEAAKAKAEASKKGSAKVKEQLVKNSVEEAEAEIKARQEKLKKLDVKDGNAIKVKNQLLKEIDQWQKELDKRKLTVGLEFKGASDVLAEYEKMLKTTQAEAEAALVLAQIHQKDALEIAELTDNWEAATKKLKDYEAVKKMVTEPVKIGREFKTEGLAGSLKEAQDKVSYYKAGLDVEVRGSKEYNLLIKRLKEWETKAEILQIQVDADTSRIQKGSLQWLTNEKSKYQAMLETSVVGSPEYYDAMKKINELTKQENKIQMEIEISGMSDLERAYAAIDGFHAIDDIKNSFESLSDAIEGNADAWETFMAVLGTVETAMNSVNTLSQVANILSKLGKAEKMEEATATSSATAATVAQSAAQSASATTAMETATANKILEKSFLDLASSMIFAAHAEIPFAGVGIASGLIQSMLSIQAATKALTSSMAAFAEGGIVGGSSYNGDKILARLNSGEMVLNQRQQSNLFNWLDTGTMPQKGGTNVQVSGVIRGTDLLLVQKNTNKVLSKAGSKISF